LTCPLPEPNSTAVSSSSDLDDRGEAVVILPAWVQALCADFRYQLTCVGCPAPVYVADEVADNHFRIVGGPAGTKVSWQLTGIREDAWARAHPLVVEQDKAEAQSDVCPLRRLVADDGDKRRVTGTVSMPR
jgi:hypothetical protein